MTALGATVAAARTDFAAALRSDARFLGHASVFWSLLVRGAVLLMFTLGIYRFWLTTDVRRFLWANTELLGIPFEYVGTARELLLGFLIAIAILVPLNTALFLVALAYGDMTGFLLSVLLLAALGHYAIYRARRYRLTRTVYRGVRFNQAGSAWRYAICAMFWWSLIIVTLGLAYPFAQSQLERFKMANTSFGDLPGRFEGSGSRLFIRGIPMWFVAVVPFIAGSIASIGAVEWTTVDAAGRSEEDALSWLETSGLANAAIYAGLTLTWVVLSVVVFYPIFQTMVLRWWVSGLRFGEVIVTSRLRTAQVYGVYGRFLCYAFLFTLLVAVLATVAAFALPNLLKAEHTTLSEIIATAALVAAYVIAALGYSTIYQATVRLGLWRCVTESVEIGGTAALDKVSAGGEASSPVGEGLADALNVGGL